MRLLWLTTGLAALVALEVLGGFDDTGPARIRRRSPAKADATVRLATRIVSTNLPTDEILLALDASARLVAISAFADDAVLSNVVLEAKQVSQRVRVQAETILALEPDLVLAFPFSSMYEQRLLEKAGVRVLHIPHASSLAQVRANVLTLGALLGRSRKAAQILCGMDRTVASVSQAVRGASAPRALLLHPGGFTSGAGTLFDELLDIAGGRNAATEAGKTGVARLSIEGLLAIDPEVLFLVHYGESQGAVTGWEALRRREYREVLRAVRSGRVYSLTQRYALATSHYAVQGAVELARLLHGKEVDVQARQACRNSNPSAQEGQAPR